jgi:hypothetical protein
MTMGHRISLPIDALGETMLDMLPAATAALTHWIHAGHNTTSAPNDIDGACPTCDFPFRALQHVCIAATVCVART